MIKPYPPKPELSKRVFYDGTFFPHLAKSLSHLIADIVIAQLEISSHLAQNYLSVSLNCFTV